MCFYEHTDYVCGDWKWGNMKERCHRQHRIGEVCGRKLFHPEYKIQRNEKCRICQDLDIKYRKLEKEKANIKRWKKEGRKFQASIEKAEGEVQSLDAQIRDLESRRPNQGQGPAQPRASLGVYHPRLCGKPKLT
jgi:hypothetical protein